MSNITNWFDYPTNWSNGSIVGGLGNLFQYTNYILEGWMGAGLLLLIWLATFGVSLVAGSQKALSVACFISFIFSVYFWRLGMVHPGIAAALLVGAVVAGVLSKDSSGGGL